MKSKIVPFLSGAMMVVGVGLLVMNQSKTNNMMKKLTCKATQIADMFKGNSKTCDCSSECKE